MDLGALLRVRHGEDKLRVAPREALHRRMAVSSARGSSRALGRSRISERGLMPVLGDDPDDGLLQLFNVPVALLPRLGVQLLAVLLEDRTRGLCRREEAYVVHLGPAPLAAGA
ncbi:hypothetical protein M406DRAFT_327461 [Cryphonectria parasitica EP155]|uniref:Uncharacterized protein n=1 Tax=Cryphonectria parasitica (strain ATCC 38755 / EP155) TaxID=660469 RepID=A0A9P5CS88_CRYP1|nr:uncharacterized protein M406DRAFT_327461 [Cryphonectria parasitica EP155]KAF3769053.1 hypothetical protein M406DRAFT_327461 [Cryphonectria parasitica EP155]